MCRIGKKSLLSINLHKLWIICLKPILFIVIFINRHFEENSKCVAL